jgi:hypothetical protein
MLNFALNKTLAVLLIGAAFTVALAPGAFANPAGSSDQIYVNPSTGFASPMPQSTHDATSSPGNPAGSSDQIYVNPSTGFASPMPQSTHEATSSPAPQPTIDEPSGFDWPSAAIGAAAIGGLLLILMGATVGAGRTGRGPLAGQRATGT